MIMRTDTN
ncbi:Bcl-2-like protein, partial [Monkeypox virus]